MKVGFELALVRWVFKNCVQCNKTPMQCDIVVVSAISCIFVTIKAGLISVDSFTFLPLTGNWTSTLRYIYADGASEAIDGKRLSFITWCEDCISKKTICWICGRRNGGKWEEKWRDMPENAIDTARERTKDGRLINTKSKRLEDLTFKMIPWPSAHILRRFLNVGTLYQ